MTTRPSLRPPVLDVLLGLAVTAFIVLVTHAMSRFNPSAGALDPLGYAWLAATGLPLIVRRRFPLAVFGVTAALAIGYYSTPYPGGPSMIAPTLALATLAYCQGAIRGSVAAGLLVLLSAVGVLVTGHPLATVGLVALFALAAVSVGSALRARKAQLAAARNEALEAERLRIEQERLGIAREVHDVVAHSLAMINVQAGTGAHVADRKPEAAKAALLEIKEASRSALNDLRATLAVLRSDSGAEHAPTPGLDRLNELTSNARAAGLSVRVHGEPGELPTHVSSAAYRILQESLTNTVRHAASASTVDVWFERADGVFALTVADDGQGSAVGTNGSGNGLRGMRERADALGGSVTAGPGEHGFRVAARLPVGEQGGAG
jgi:signal transduction histidine kinase